MTSSDFEPPSEILVNRRWIKPERYEWALEADSILRGHGHVNGTSVYGERWQARNRARKLIELLVQLDLYERWELQEHTNRVPPGRGKGWLWAVEYIGGGPINGRR